MRAIGDGFSILVPLSSEGELEVLGADRLAFELFGNENRPALPSDEASSRMDKYDAEYVGSSKLLSGVPGSVNLLQS